MSNWAVYRIYMNKEEETVKNARGSNGKSSNIGEYATSDEVIDFNEESGKRGASLSM